MGWCQRREPLLRPSLHLWGHETGFGAAAISHCHAEEAETAGSGPPTYEGRVAVRADPEIGGAGEGFLY